MLVVAVLLTLPVGTGSPADAVGAHSGARRCTVVGTQGDDVLIGTRRADVICGLGGDDVLRGRGDDDVLRGGAGDDRLVGRGGDDVLRGGGGDDALIGSRGDDRVLPGLGTDSADGGSGTDELAYSDLDCQCFMKVDLAEGSGIEQYNQGVQVVDTVLHFEDLVGSDSWDELRGDDGANHIDGGTGRDHIWPRHGQDVIDGGGWYQNSYDSPVGGDTVDYSDRVGAGVTVDLLDGTGPEGSVVTTIANVVGTAHDDTVIGSPQHAGSLTGLAGDDVIVGMAPCGSLSGGEGDDTLVPDLTSASCILWDDHGQFSWPVPQTVDGGPGVDRADFSNATGAVVLTPPDEPYGDFDEWPWMLGSYEQTLISVDVVEGTPWADVLRGGGGEAAVTLHGGGGDDEMDTTDGFGGDAMVQDGTGPGTVCSGDAGDTADC